MAINMKVQVKFESICNLQTKTEIQLEIDGYSQKNNFRGISLKRRPFY